MVYWCTLYSSVSVRINLDLHKKTEVFGNGCLLFLLAHKVPGRLQNMAGAIMVQDHTVEMSRRFCRQFMGIDISLGSDFDKKKRRKSLMIHCQGLKYIPLYSSTIVDCKSINPVIGQMQLSNPPLNIVEPGR